MNRIKLSLAFMTLMAGGRATSVTLPQNFLLNPGTVLDNFDNPGDWTAANGAVDADTTNYKVGTQSVRLTTTSGGDATMVKTVNWDLSNAKMVSVWIYFGSPVADYTSTVLFRFSSDASATNHYYQTFKIFPIHNVGWNLFQFPLNFFIPQGAPNWSSIIRVYFRIKGAVGKTPSISVSKLTTGIVGIPTCLMRFDDSYSEQYTDCFSYMNQFGIRGTENVITDGIGTAGRLSAAQLVEMDAAGWAICNHTDTHTNLTTLSEALQEARLLGGMNDLDAIGLTRCSRYVAFPQNSSNANTLTAMTNTGMLAGGGVYNGINRNTTPTVPMILPTENNLYSMITGHDCTYTLETLASAKSYVDMAIAGGVGIVPQFHRIGNDADQFTLADFQAYVDYVRSKALAGLIHIVTYDDVYKATLGPVTIPSII